MQKELIKPKDAFIIVDVQNDFCPGGALEVPEGDEIVPVINRISSMFSICAATQDWHPDNHISFASMHQSKIPFQTIELNGMDQILWPDHCVRGTQGAEFFPELDMIPVKTIFRKGMKREVDTYSGFRDNDKKTETGLRGYLQSLNVKRIFICGLATDVCVKATVLDGLEFEFDVFLILDACRGVNQPDGSVDAALKAMKSASAVILDSSDLQTQNS